MDIDMNGIRNQFVEDGLHRSQMLFDVVRYLLNEFLALRSAPRRRIAMPVDGIPTQRNDVCCLLWFLYCHFQCCPTSTGRPDCSSAFKAKYVQMPPSRSITPNSAIMGLPSFRMAKAEKAMKTTKRV